MRTLFTKQKDFSSENFMNKLDIIKKIAEEFDITQETSTHIVNTFVDVLADALIKGTRIEIRGFGSFKLKDYAGYIGRNPRAGNYIAVKPKRLPIFRAGKVLTGILNS